MGDVGLQGQRCSILGPEHWKCSDDASGAQELRHLGCSQPDGHLLRHRFGGHEGTHLELSYIAVKLRRGKKGTQRHFGYSRCQEYGDGHLGNYGSARGKSKALARYDHDRGTTARQYDLLNRQVVKGQEASMKHRAAIWQSWQGRWALGLFPCVA